MAEAKKIICPNCGQSYAARPEQWAQYLGRTIKCKKCQQPFTVTDPQAPEPPMEAFPQAAPAMPQLPHTYAPSAPPAFAQPGVPGARAGNGLAIASLVLGILSCVPGLGLVALILGILGLRRTKDPRVGGKGFAITGLILGALSVGFYCLSLPIAIPAYARAREIANRVKCASNLHQIGQGILLYQNDNFGAFPPDLDILTKQESLPASALVCPSDSAGQDSYIYVRPKKNQLVTPNSVLVYESISHHHQGINVLVADGRVLFKAMTAAQMAAFEQQLRLGQNPPPMLLLIR